MGNSLAKGTGLRGIGGAGLLRTTAQLAAAAASVRQSTRAADEAAGPVSPGTDLTAASRQTGVGGAPRVFGGGGHAPEVVVAAFCAKCWSCACACEA